MNLIFIALGSYFVAGAANSVIARQIRVVPSVEDRVQETGDKKARSKERRESFSQIANRNLFGVKRENLGPVVEPIESPKTITGGDYDPSDLQSCSLPISIRGTLVSDGAPEWSVAVIYNNTKREASVFSIRDGSNDLGSGGTLLEIRSREVIVRKGDHVERCLAEGEQKKGSKKPKSRPKPSGSSSSGDSGGVNKVSDTEYNIEKGEIDRVLGNLSAVATKARIVPSFKNGKPNGFKLFSIKPGSIYSKIGLKNGDVIQKVNGYEMNSPDKALEIYQNPNDAQNVTVDVQRRGRSMTMNYSIGR